MCTIDKISFFLEDLEGRVLQFDRSCKLTYASVLLLATLYQFKRLGRKKERYFTSILQALCLTTCTASERSNANTTIATKKNLEPRIELLLFQRNDKNHSQHKLDIEGGEIPERYQVFFLSRTRRGGQAS